MSETLKIPEQQPAPSPLPEEPILAHDLPTQETAPATPPTDTAEQAPDAIRLSPQDFTTLLKDVRSNRTTTANYLQTVPLGQGGSKRLNAAEAQAVIEELQARGVITKEAYKDFGFEVLPSSAESQDIRSATKLRKVGRVALKIAVPSKEVRKQIKEVWNVRAIEDTKNKVRAVEKGFEFISGKTYLDKLTAKEDVLQAQRNTDRAWERARSVRLEFDEQAEPSDPAPEPWRPVVRERRRREDSDLDSRSETRSTGRPMKPRAERRPGDSSTETPEQAKTRRLDDAFKLALEHIGGFYSDTTDYKKLPRLSRESLSTLLLNSQPDITLEEVDETYVTLQAYEVLDDKGNVNQDVSDIREALKVLFDAEPPEHDTTETSPVKPKDVDIDRFEELVGRATSTRTELYKREHGLGHGDTIPEDEFAVLRQQAEEEMVSLLVQENGPESESLVRTLAAALHAREAARPHNS